MALESTNEPNIPDKNEATSNKKSHFDQFLDQSGGFGLYQLFTVAILFVSMMIISFHTVLMCFAATEPEWKCTIANTSTCPYNDTMPGENQDRCQIPRSDWSYIKPTSSVVSQFDVDCERRWWVYIMSSIFFIGWCIGACVLGWVGEVYGRKTVLFPSVGAVILLGFATSFSPNVYVFTALRFIVGFIAPGVQSQCVVISSEITGTKWRGAAVIMSMSGYSVGCAVLGAVAYYVRDWKWIIIYSTLPYTFIGVFYKIFPESPRWLIVNGHSAAYSKLLNTISKWNKTKISKVPPMILPRVERKQDTNKPNVMTICRHGLVKALALAYFTFTIGVVFYGILLSANNLGGNLYTDFITLNLTDLPANFILELFLRSFGRRKTIPPSMIICGTFCLSIAFTPHNSTFMILRTGLGLTGKFFIIFCLNGIFTWSSEQYPTALRSTAVGLFQFTQHTGAICAPWIAQGVFYFSPKAPFAVMGLMTLLAGFLGLVLPETKNKELDEGQPQKTLVV